MSVILGLVFLGIVTGLGIRRKSKATKNQVVALSTIDQKTVILKLR